MADMEIPPEARRLFASIKNKRARIVIEHILKHGHVTTEDLQKKYGYDHPPRAVRDVREYGIPIERFYVKSSEGKSIAAYGFGNLNRIEKEKSSGRVAYPKKLRKFLYDLNEGKCFICGGRFEQRYLQIDHRVPYEIRGDSGHLEYDHKDLMLICGSCNRSKSWSCEHCSNWIKTKSVKRCLNCYWGNPEDYSHIALKRIRRLDLIWEKHSISVYEKLLELSKSEELPLPDYVKIILEKYINNN